MYIIRLVMVQHQAFIELYIVYAIDATFNAYSMYADVHYENHPRLVNSGSQHE